MGNIYLKNLVDSWAETLTKEQLAERQQALADRIEQVSVKSSLHAVLKESKSNCPKVRSLEILRPHFTGARVGERRGGEGESEGCGGREGARPAEGRSGVGERKGRRGGAAGRPRAAEHRVGNDGGLRSAGDDRHKLRIGERGRRRRRAMNASFTSLHCFDCDLEFWM